MRLLLVVSAALPLYCQITIDTFAGGAVRSGVPAQNVFLESINGLAWDPAGNIVFCDTQNNVIRRVRRDGILETIAGTGVLGFAGDGGPANGALLNTPLAPRYDAAGDLYFADSRNFRIRRIDPKGVITTVAGDGIAFVTGMDSSGPALQRSLALVVDLEADSSGNVYFSESVTNRVRLLTTDGRLDTFVSLTPGEYSGSMAMDGAGDLYLVQTKGLQYEAIVRIARDGTFSTFREWTATGKNSVSMLAAIAADAAGNVYGVQAGTIVRFGADGSATTVAGGGGSGYVSSPDGAALPSVMYPFVLAIDPHSNIAFGDSFTPVNHYLTLNEIRVVTSDSQLETLAGGSPQITPDGTPLRSVWFEQLASIAFSRAGDLYIAESRACKLRKVGADGILKTFAGTGNCAYPAPSGPNAKTADIVQPESIAVDSQNRVWVADAYLNLYSIAQDGTISNIIKTPVEGGTGKLAIDSKDRVYVLGMDSLYRVLTNGTYQALIPPPSNGGTGAFTDLTGIGADASGNVYFSSFGTIYYINDDGTFAPAYLDQTFANSLALDSAHRIWQGSFTEIDVASPAGIAKIGDPRAGMSGDGGPANSSRISSATWLVFSPAGDLYFVDSNRIRRLTGIGNAVPGPSINPGGVVNAASYTGGAISPSELVAIFGSNFGTSALQTAVPSNSFFPLSLGRTRVLFNGFPGAVTAVAPNQINVFVPSEVGSAATASVVVEVDSALSQPLTGPVAAATPGISTLDLSGSGQGAIVNQDGTVNSASNPAARGSIVSLYGTGFGVLSPQLPYGALSISTPFSIAQAQVAVTIGGQPAEVLYSGASPFLADGVFQINARIPANAAFGNDAVLVAVGGFASAQQVTVAVR